MAKRKNMLQHKPDPGRDNRRTPRRSRRRSTARTTPSGSRAEYFRASGCTPTDCRAFAGDWCRPLAWSSWTEYVLLPGKLARTCQRV